jgi:hypothetical protein
MNAPQPSRKAANGQGRGKGKKGEAEWAQEQQKEAVKDITVVLWIASALRDEQKFLINFNLIYE